MRPDPARYLVSAALLGATAPLTLAELVTAGCGPRPAVMNALWDLAEEGLALEGSFADGPGPQYVWAARWRGGGLAPAVEDPGRDLSVESDVVREFNDFVLRGYRPPADKRLLAVFPCSVRRPFSKSPSHASMRRAVAMATGRDPAREFASCPVHVVVLASRIGPVPYELEDFWPANVRGGGVKHFREDLYAEVRPILVERMAAYLATHGPRYRRAAAFGGSRYGVVVAEAASRAGGALPIFPDRGGPRVERIGGRVPRNYWQRYWIQLALEIIRWLTPEEGEAARERLRAHGVEYR